MDPGTVGFHISALYSPLGWYCWQQIARDWEACQGNDEATFLASSIMYNARRPHSAIGYLSPSQVEEDHRARHDQIRRLIPSGRRGAGGRVRGQRCNAPLKPTRSSSERPR
jgi:hypothetical protein